MNKKIYAFILALCAMSFLFCSCKDTEVIEENIPDEVIQDEVLNNEETDIAEVENAEITEETVIEYKSLSDYDTRPVAVMLNNLKIAAPQSGISKAEVVYECIVEGSITRLLAIFPDYRELPVLGSVRSSRDYYIDLAQAHDAIYIHAGGSPMAYTVLKNRNVDNIDGVNGGSEAHSFWRDSDRRAKAGLEHSMVIDGEGLLEAIEIKKYRTENNKDFVQPLKYSKTDTVPDGEDAMKVSVPFSSYITAEFEYDAETKLYKKSQFGVPHIDANTSEQLTYKNVIVIFAKYANVPGDDKGRQSINFVGNGDAIFVSDGKAKNITWNKTDRTSAYTLCDKEGEILINPGKTYICIVQVGTDITFN